MDHSLSLKLKSYLFISSYNYYWLKFYIIYYWRLQLYSRIILNNKLYAVITYSLYRCVQIHNIQIIYTTGKQSDIKKEVHAVVNLATRMT